MIAIILLLLLTAPAWSLAQATEEISLFEAARRERERRASITVEVKVLTNRDVEEMEGLVSTAIVSEPAAEASEEVESEEVRDLKLAYGPVIDHFQHGVSSGKAPSQSHGTVLVDGAGRANRTTRAEHVKVDAPDARGDNTVPR